MPELQHAPRSVASASPSNVVFPSCRSAAHARCPVESHNTSVPVACACPCHAPILASHRPPNPACFDAYALAHPAPSEVAWLQAQLPDVPPRPLYFARYLYLTNHFLDDYPVPEHFQAAHRPLPPPRPLKGASAHAAP